MFDETTGPQIWHVFETQCILLGMLIRIRFAYIPYSNLGFKFVHYFHVVMISSIYNK